MRFRNFAIAVQAALLGITAPAMAEETAVCEMLDGYAGELAGIAGHLQTMSSLVDGTPLDVEMAVETNDFMGEALAEYVSSQIGFAPYQGAIRGAGGVLASGSGNALDQSLLLTAMLEHAGYDAQILYIAEPDAELTARLASAALQGTRRTPAFSDPSRFASAVEQFAVSGGVQHELPDLAEMIDALSSDAAEPVSARVRAVAERLTDMEEGGAPFNPGTYHWVRYRLGAGMSWTEAHPALGDAAPEDLSPDGAITGTVPEELLHYVRIELHAELLESGTLRTVPVMDAWRQPVAALLDVPVTLGLSVSRPGTGNEAGASVVPVLNGQIAPGASLVTLTGTVLDTGVMEMDRYGMAGVFSALGDQLQEGAQVASGGPADQPVRALTGMILKVAWMRPDGTERVEERWLLDRLVNRGDTAGPPRLDLSITPSDAMDQLQFVRQFFIAPAGPGDAYLMRRSLDAASNQFEQVAAILRSFDPATGEIDPQTGTLPRTHAPLLLSLATALDQPLDLPQGHAVFRHGPLILSQHARAGSDGEATDYIDILMNPWMGVKAATDGLESWPGGAVLRGVFDTGVEVAFGVEDESGDYLGLLLDSETRVIRDAAGLAGWPQAARLAAAHDLEQGFVVAAPAAIDGNFPRWWRVDAEGGEVLGRSALGGQVLTERAVKEMEAAIGLVSDMMFFYAVDQCLERFGENQADGACCMIVTGTGALVGQGIGRGLSGAGTYAAGMGVSMGAGLLGLAILHGITAGTLEVAGAVIDNTFCS